MAQNFRHDVILKIARDTGKVTVDGLSAHFDVTAQTIRRDLGELCNLGHLTRVHGGAIPPSTVLNPGYEERSHLAVDEKEAMAELCAAQIPDGVSLFLNIGTTTEAVARALLNHKNLMVITNNLNVANILATSPHSEVIVTGGVLRRSDGGLIGDIAAEVIKQFRVDYAVIGIAAIAEDGVLLDHDFREVRVTQAIIENSRKSFLLADAIKYTRHAPVRIGSLADMDTFITDETPPEAIRQLCAESDVTIHVAQ
ncbi:MAG: DeoR/GlpR transcriptional regulator [Rhodobacteraceae bacterium]|nr:DeoR/GlpR transcriptional regulator [Paracoccaceae bacterium]